MNGLQRFCREAVAWKHLRHPNVLPLLGVTVSERRFAMVSKWMEHGNINEFVEKYEHVNRTELVCCSLIPLLQSLTDALFSWLTLRVA
jgi:serine/threonine protein kinase